MVAVDIIPRTALINYLDTGEVILQSWESAEMSWTYQQMANN